MSAFHSLEDGLPDRSTNDDNPVPVSSGSSTSFAPSLVGRLRELDAIRARLIAASRGNGGIVTLTGETGIGKTRLAREASALARKHQFGVVRTRVMEGDWLPAYQSWIDIVTQAMTYLPPNGQNRESPAWAPPLAQLVPAIAETYPDSPVIAPVTGNEERFRTCNAVTSCLVEIAANQPLFVMIDDLQWADPDSIRLLQYLAPAASSARIVVILLLRDDHLTANAVLGDAFAHLQREECFQEIHLRGLDQAKVGQLVASMAHQPVSGDIVRLIYDATQGNPFFVQELARYLLEENLIDFSGAHEKQLRLQDLRLPDSLRHVIERRLQQLSPDAEGMLRLAAVCTSGFDDAILAALTGYEESILLDAIDEALSVQLIAPMPERSERYDFVHPLIRYILYAGWGPSRRIRLHRHLAESLAGRTPLNVHQHAAEIAEHYHLSRSLPECERGIPFAIAAAAHAKREYDAEQVIHFYRIARDLSHAQPPEERADILAALTLTEAEAFHLDDSLRTAGDALAALAEADAPRGKRAALIATAVTALHDAGMPSEAWIPMLNYGLELTPPEDEQTWARLTLLIQRFEVIVDGVINGSRWLGSNEQAVTIARTRGDEDLYARSLQPWDLWDRTWTDELSARIRTWHTPSAIIRALTVSSADWLYHHGDFRRAMSEFEDLLDISARHYSTPGQAEAHVRLALIQTAFGNLARAREFEQQARLFVSRLGHGHRLHASLWWVVALQTEYQGGDWAAIADYFVTYIADPNIARGTIALDDAALAALALVRTGNPDHARQLLTTLANVLARVGPDLWLLNGTVAFGALAVWELRAADLAQIFYDVAVTLIDTHFGDFPCSSLHLTVARMATLMGNTGSANRAFDLAREYLDASGQAPQRAMTEFDQAQALAEFAQPDIERALQLMENAIARLRTLHMGIWANRGQAKLVQWAEQRAHTAIDPGALSVREVEVLQLIARGLSDKQISDRMFVSPRTVHAHIRNMLSKTHTNNRTELTMWALEHDLVSRTSEPHTS